MNIDLILWRTIHLNNLKSSKIVLCEKPIDTMSFLFKAIFLHF